MSVSLNKGQQAIVWVWADCLDFATSGFCHIWIPNFGLIANPFIISFRDGPQSNLFEWDKACDQVHSSHKDLESETPSNEEVWRDRFTFQIDGEGRVGVVSVVKG